MPSAAFLLPRHVCYQGCPSALASTVFHCSPGAATPIHWAVHGVFAHHALLFQRKHADPIQKMLVHACGPRVVMANAVPCPGRSSQTWNSITAVVEVPSDGFFSFLMSLITVCCFYPLTKVLSLTNAFLLNRLCIKRVSSYHALHSNCISLP